MAGANKPDFPGLLAAGFHVLTIDQIRQTCVVPFTLSTTRPLLYANLESLVGRFQKCGICCDLWVDGSFVTKKINPQDIDLVARVPAHSYNEPSDSPIATTLEWFETSAELALNIDAYLFPEYPPGDPLYAVTMERLAY